MTLSTAHTMPKEPTTATAALVKALAELHNVSANKTVKANFTAKYVSLDVLLDAIKPILAKHDLALRQQIISEDGKVGVLTQFIHADGTTFDAGRLLLKADGLTPQQVGSLVTYSRRITASTAAGVSVDTDDDGAAASRPAAPSDGRDARRPDGGCVLCGARRRDCLGIVTVVAGRNDHDDPGGHHPVHENARAVKAVLDDSGRAE